MAASIRELRSRFTRELDRAGVPEAQRKVDLWLSHEIQVPMLEVPYCETIIANEKLAEFEHLSQRLAAHEPLQYVLGETAFRELDLLCDARALVPRFETEQLIDLIPDQGWNHIIDVGTGTGCIALAVATRFPGARITAIDRSPEALALARANAEKNRIERIVFKQGDLLTDEPAASADLILANLPYISTEEMHVLPPDVLRYEPHLALHSGATGMELCEELLSQATKVLKPTGLLLLEIGEKQGESLCRFAGELGYTKVQAFVDLAGKTRFISGVNNA